MYTIQWHVQDLVETMSLKIIIKKQDSTMSTSQLLLLGCD